MKIRQDEKLAVPVNLMLGDSIQLLYEERHPFTGEVLSKQVVAQDTVDRPMLVDRGIIFDLEQHELDALGLKDALGGMFGESK